MEWKMSTGFASVYAPWANPALKMVHNREAGKMVSGGKQRLRWPRDRGRKELSGMKRARQQIGAIENGLEIQ
jgi:hypothetical protein